MPRSSRTELGRTATISMSACWTAFNTGYTWKESARLLGASVPSLRSAFWRDVARVKRELKNAHKLQKPQSLP